MTRTRRRRRATALVLLAAMLPPLLAPRDALAEQAAQLENPAALPRRQANFAWDKSLLRASFSFRDIADPSVVEKLSSGLPSVIVMRAYVFEEGRTEPVALAARTCNVVYDLWDEVYRIKVADPEKDRNVAVINVEGVLRQCMEARDLPIVDRSVLKAHRPLFLGVIAEVNPISPAMLQQIRQWVSRPTGSTGISAGDALFGSFVGLFVRQLGTSDRTLLFRTQTFVP
jgi:hypothetical protein